MAVDSPVDAEINRLAALQEMDRQLREKTELMQGLDSEIAALETQLSAQREATRAAQAQRDEVEVRRRELESQLEAEESKMKERRMRLNRVRNEKELSALRREIEVGKEANQLAEEEVLRVLESAEALAAAAADAARTLAELETTAAANIAERRARVNQCVAEVACDRRERDRLAETLDAKLLEKYEQIFKRRGGTAVVEVRNGTCLGCHMHVPPQFFNELQRAREVRLCPNCHRILFWRPERLESADSPR